MGSYNTYKLKSKDNNINVDLHGYYDMEFEICDYVSIDFRHMNKI